MSLYLQQAVWIWRGLFLNYKVESNILSWYSVFKYLLKEKEQHMKQEKVHKEKTNSFLIEKCL